jgi:hypothetical protein
MIRVNQAVFVVTESRNSTDPLYLSFRFQDAKAFTLSFNRLTQSGRSVIRPGCAAIRFDEAKSCSESPSTS